MPKYWMITDRTIRGDGLSDQLGGLTYWVTDDEQVDDFSKWKKVTAAAFQKQLLAATDQFPLITDPDHFDQQKHVALFVHGYNNGWRDAANRYQKICRSLFHDKGLGICVLYSWPSAGSPAEYLPDRESAREAAGDLAQVLSDLYDWLTKKQIDAASDPEKGCKAQTSVIAHSMGNYVFQKAMQLAWTRKNRPLLVSLITQLLMVAADVDNDLFKSGDTVDASDGDAIANLCYRVAVLYCQADRVLGASANLKHFGKRRLGRSGLDPNVPIPDNVCEFDCTPFIGDADNVHSAYFDNQKTIDLTRGILQGVDRKILAKQFGLATSAVGQPA